MKIRVGGEQGIIFQCNNDIARLRAKTLFTKEPGTIEWLSKSIQTERPDYEVFFDVGANVGCYALLAAKKGATVVAFEPHLETAALLAHNARLNGLERSIAIITSPLDCVAGLTDFLRSSAEAGTSGHGVASYHAAPAELSLVMSHDRQETKGTRERVYTTTIDDLVAAGMWVPTMMKIDVDGNELDVLRGGDKTLSSPRLRTVQVEMPTATREGIHAYMREHGFTHSHDHFTALGQKALDEGAAQTSIVYNAVFVRA